MRNTVLILTLTGLISLPIYAFDRNIDPAEPNMPSNPYWAHNANLVLDSPLQLVAVQGALETVSQTLLSPSYKKLAVVFVLIGLLITFAVATAKISIIDPLFYLVVTLIIFIGFTARPLGIGDTIRIASYSSTYNQIADYSFRSEHIKVPLFLGISVRLINVLNTFLMRIVDNFGQNISGVFYKSYPFFVGDGIIKVMSLRIQNPDLLRRLQVYTDKCFKGPILSYLNHNGTLTVNDWETLKRISDTVKIADNTNKAVVSCGDYWGSLYADIHRYFESYVGDLRNDRGKNVENYYKIIGTIRLLKHELDDEYTDDLDVATWFGVSREIQNTFWRQANASLNPGYDDKKNKNILDHIFGFFGKTFGIPIAGSMGRLIGELSTRYIPILNAYALAIGYLIFPWILLLSLLPGAHKTLYEYMKGLLWLHSWTPALMLVNSLTNAFLTSNIYNRFTAVTFHGLLSNSFLTTLTTSSNVAFAIGGMMAIFTPILTYALVARGSLSGIIAGSTAAMSNAITGVRVGVSYGTRMVTNTTMGTLTRNLTPKGTFMRKHENSKFS